MLTSCFFIPGHRFQLSALPSTAQVKSEDDSEEQGPIVVSGKKEGGGKAAVWDPNDNLS